MHLKSGNYICNLCRCLLFVFFSFTIQLHFFCKKFIVYVLILFLELTAGMHFDAWKYLSNYDHPGTKVRLPHVVHKCLALNNFR